MGHPGWRRPRAEFGSSRRLGGMERQRASQPEAKVTFCRICEPHCGMVATVEDGRVTQASARPRASALARLRLPEGHRDDRGPERPRPGPAPAAQARRTGRSSACPGTTRSTTSAPGCGAILDRARPGGRSAGTWATRARSATPTRCGSRASSTALGTPHYYTASSQDVEQPLRRQRAALRVAAGDPDPRPEAHATSCSWSAPTRSSRTGRCSPRRASATSSTRSSSRGGRVVVVDPRRTETARAYEHVAVRPDGDAWLLLSLLHVIFEEGLADEAALARADHRRRRAARGRRAGTRPRPRRSAPASPPTTCARSPATLPPADGAAVYGRTGSCLGRFGTLVAYLLDALNAVTGNLDRARRRGVRAPGGRARRRRRAGRPGHLRQAERSRFGGFPDVIGSHAGDADAARDRRRRASGRSAPSSSAPATRCCRCPTATRSRRRSSRLELMVSLDFYVNETNRHADYVLPATTWLEREDVPLAFLGFYTTPFVQYSEPVVRAGRRGAPGVADHRRHRPAHRGRALLGEASAAPGRARPAPEAAAGSSTCCCAPAPAA